MTRPGIEPWSLGPLANTLPTRSMSRTRSALIVGIMWFIFISKSPRISSASFLGLGLFCTYTILNLVTLENLAQIPVDHLSHPVMYSLLLILFEFAAFFYGIINHSIPVSTLFNRNYLKRYNCPWIMCINFYH